MGCHRLPARYRVVTQPVHAPPVLALVHLDLVAFDVAGALGRLPSFVVEPKLDGVAVALRFRAGELVDIVAQPIR